MSAPAATAVAERHIRLDASGSALQRQAQRSSTAMAERVARAVLAVLEKRYPPQRIRALVTASASAALNAIVGREHDPGVRYHLRSVHACPIGARVVEACAVVSRAGRSHALTMRLEQRGLTWRCADLSLL